MMGSKINSRRQKEGWAKRHIILFISCFLSSLCYCWFVLLFPHLAFPPHVQSVASYNSFFRSSLSRISVRHTLSELAFRHSTFFYFITASLVSLVAVKTDIKTFRSGMKRFNQCKQNGGHLSPVAGGGRRCGRPGAAN